MKKLLLVSNDVSLTGAPILLLELAKYLCKQYQIHFWSIFDIPKHCNSLQNDFELIGPVKYFHNYTPTQNDISSAKSYYDIIICNTIETSNIALQLNALLWYHEMFINSSYLLNNIRIISLSNRHTKLLNSKGVHSIIATAHGKINNKVNKSLNSNKIKKILLIGSFIYRKNQLKALDIVRPYDNIELTMVGSFVNYETGDDGYYQQVKANIGDINCKLIDVQPHEKVLEMIQESDIIMCPSIQDTYPVCIIEALEYGKRVLLTDNTCIDLDELLVKPYKSRCVNVNIMSKVLGEMLQDDCDCCEVLNEYCYEEKWNEIIKLF